jgi:DHA2 family multidrug resistance protein
VDTLTLMIPTIIQGAAVACFFIPLVSITLAGLPSDKIASASGLSNFLRITAGAFGTSISTTVWDDRATMHHAHLVEAVTHGNAVAGQTLSQLEASGLSPAQALASLDRVVWSQAYVLSTNDVFYASAIIFLVLLPLVWLAKRPQAAADAGGAH